MYLLLDEYLGLTSTHYERCAVALLLYPAFGPTETHDPSETNSAIYQALGDEGMDLYKKIFENNNKQLVQAFFSNQLIRKLWAFIRNELTYTHCFP